MDRQRVQESLAELKKTLTWHRALLQRDDASTYHSTMHALQHKKRTLSCIIFSTQTDVLSHAKFANAHEPAQVRARSRMVAQTAHAQQSTYLSITVRQSCHTFITPSSLLYNQHQSLLSHSYHQKRKFTQKPITQKQTHTLRSVE